VSAHIHTKKCNTAIGNDLEDSVVWYMVMMSSA